MPERDLTLELFSYLLQVNHSFKLYLSINNKNGSKKRLTLEKKKKGAAEISSEARKRLAIGVRVKIFEIESISLNAFGNPNQT